MKVKWLRIALADLDVIFEHIAADNKTAARETVEHIWNSAKALAGHPNIGRSGRVAGTRELVIADSSYIVPYRVRSSEVQILRVLHAARKWPEKF